MSRVGANNFIAELCARVPEFRREHDSEILESKDFSFIELAHDLTNFVIMQYGSGNCAPASAFRRTVDYLEEVAACGDINARSLIDLYFTENLHQAGSAYSGIKSHLGPTLRKELERLDGKNPDFS